MQTASSNLLGRPLLKLAALATIGGALLGGQSHDFAVYGAEISPPSTVTSALLVSQATEWDSALRVARLTNSSRQVTDLVLQLDVSNKPTTTYANAVYQVFAKTEDSDWEVIYTNRGARLLPSESGRTTLEPEVIAIDDLTERLKDKFGQDIELEDVELNCTTLIRYDLPGGGRDLRETFEFTQLYTSLQLVNVIDLIGISDTTPPVITTPPVTTTPPPSSQPTVYDQTITLSNGYRVTLLDVVFNGTVSTWRYYVEELPVAQDLSNWVLGLPSCAVVVNASPRGELVNPDPNARISGIKWQPGGGFVEGEFSVTLEGSLKVGEIQVAVKGPDVVLGTIRGPACQ